MLIDISQELFSCRVYPGDPAPQKESLSSMERGDLYDLSAFSMCAHNGTHVDAPRHFIRGGKTIGQLTLEPFAGPCYVAVHNGDVRRADAEAILNRARLCNAEKRILIGGDTVVTEEAAQVFASADILLLGNEGQTVGPPDAPMQVHLILLGKGVVLLEGLVLQDVAEGKYLLSAAPLNLGGCEGAPCRAFLATPDESHSPY